MRKVKTVKISSFDYHHTGNTFESQTQTNGQTSPYQPFFQVIDLIFHQPVFRICMFCIF